MKKIIRLTELDLVSTINKIIAEHKFITEISDLQSPYEKLMTCKFTSDGKYVVYEGKAYSTITGNEVLINEGWSLSDILHTGADLLSAGMDFVIPGSGAVVDILNALSYIIEAQFKSEKERDSLYIMAAITFAFVIMPGPLQAIAIPLKRAVKTGVGLASKIVVKGLKIVAGILDTILLKLPSKIKSALQSPLAKTILGKFRGKITGFIDNFTSRIKKILESLKGVGIKKGKQKVIKKGTNTLTNISLQAAKKFFNKIPKLSQGTKILKKSGFVPGFTYRYTTAAGKGTAAKIMKVTDNGVLLKFSKGNEMMVPIETFVTRAVGAPWMRRGFGTTVPFFIKRFADMLTSDGSNIDNTKLDQLSDLDPSQTSKESLLYLTEEVSSYEGDTGSYTVNTNVQNIQKALLALGYQLPNAGADGKFGPETKTALEEFQSKNGLTTSKGKMDRLTAKKLAEKLKSKNVEPELQNSLNKM